MAAGDRPDAVGHGDDEEARHALRDAQRRSTAVGPDPHASNRRRSAAEEHEGAKVPINSATCLFDSYPLHATKSPVRLL